MPSVERLSLVVGTEVAGLDVSQPLDEAAIRWIAGQLAGVPVLVLRSQKLDAAPLGALAPLRGYCTNRICWRATGVRLPGSLTSQRVARRQRRDPLFGRKRATTWHTEREPISRRSAAAPCTGSKCPGGGTLLADMRAAFDALPAPRHDRLRRDDRAAQVHRRPGRRPQRATQLTREARGPEGLRSIRRWWRHPRRPRSCIREPHARFRAHWAATRTRADHRARRPSQPRLPYHHRWRVGDLVIWDEVSTMHKGTAIHRPTSAAVLMPPPSSTRPRRIGRVGRWLGSSAQAAKFLG